MNALKILAGTPTAKRPLGWPRIIIFDDIHFNDYYLQCWQWFYLHENAKDLSDILATISTEIVESFDRKMADLWGKWQNFG